MGETIFSNFTEIGQLGFFTSLYLFASLVSKEKKTSPRLGSIPFFLIQTHAAVPIFFRSFRLPTNNPKILSTRKHIENYWIGNLGNYRELLKMFAQVYSIGQEYLCQTTLTRLIRRIHNSSVLLTNKTALAGIILELLISECHQRTLAIYNELIIQ